MKIVILCPKSEFTITQQDRLSNLGTVIYTENRDEYPIDELIAMSHDCDILAVDPGNLGGWELATERLKELVSSIPNLKGIPLDTTSFQHVDLEYCQKNAIHVTHTPHYSTESVAEHVIAFILGCAKRIFLSDRRTQKGEYQLVEGFEVKGKVLGILGLGHIGTRVAELGKAIGMRTIAWNRSPKNVSGIEMKSLDEVLAESDIISINFEYCKETDKFLSKARIDKLKNGVVLVNTADRYIVDEEAIAVALKTGKVDSYALEGEDLSSPPLGEVENAFLFKAFGWYTKEALTENKEMWVNNIEAIAKGLTIPNPVPGF